MRASAKPDRDYAIGLQMASVKCEKPKRLESLLATL